MDATIAAFNRMSERLAELDAEVRRAHERAHLTEIGEIARGFAHSLRNPLNALGLSIQELATAHGTDTEREEVLATCRTQIERIDRTLRSFLALSALGDREPREIDVASVAEDVAMEAAQAAGRSVNVQLEPIPERPRLAGLAPELRSALQVLVVNAVEASPPGGTVAIRVTPAPDGARIEVEDDGPGLPASVRQRLFQPHVTTKEHGAGLGLFLAERIATRRYRGRLTLEDREPRGTRAVLWLRGREGTDRG
jgi:signal transduction histidine kinase